MKKQISNFIGLMLFNCVFALVGNAQLDTQFGTNGLASLVGTNAETQGTHIKMDKNGDIIALGRVNLGQGIDKLLLTKIDSNGTAELYGKTSYVLLPQLGNSQYPYNLLLTEDKIFVVYTELFQNTYQGQLVKFNTDFTLDSIFATNGRFNLPLQGDKDFFFTQALTGKDGAIFLNGGINIRTDTSRSGLIIKLNNQGKIDSSFGINGFKNYSIFANGFPAIMALDAQKEDVYLTEFTLLKKELSISKLNGLGKTDSTFGVNGIATITSTLADLYPKQIMITADHQIMIATNISYSTSLIKSGLFKMDENGALDTSFGKNGLSEIDQFPKLNRAIIIALTKDNDNNFILGYTSPSVTNKYVAAVSLHSDGSVNDSFVNKGLLYVPSYNPMAMLVDNKNRMLFCGKFPDFVVSRYNSNKLETNTINQPTVSNFCIAPNPNGGKFKLQVSNQSTAVYYEVYSMTGQVIAKSAITNSTSNICLDVKKGMYLIRLFDPLQNPMGMEKLMLE